MEKLALSMYLAGYMPDFVMRMGVRRILQESHMKLMAGGPAAQEKKRDDFIEELKKLPIAKCTDEANEQHYEVRSRFYELSLGPRRKYSCALYEPGTSSLEKAEVDMMELYLERLQIPEEASLDILDMGCGWGSASLFIAERRPKCRVLGVSNSSSQREFILKEAERRGLKNVKVETANIANWETKANSFDHVISIEMLEHMKNYQQLFRKVSKWLKPDGLFFAHIFTHVKVPYHFDDDDWMSKTFFSGGIMPSVDLFYDFQDDLKIEERWELNGKHYEKTNNAWLKHCDANKAEILEMFQKKRRQSV